MDKGFRPSLCSFGGAQEWGGTQGLLALEGPLLQGVTGLGGPEPHGKTGLAQSRAGPAHNGCKGAGAVVSCSRVAD